MREKTKKTGEEEGRRGARGTGQCVCVCVYLHCCSSVHSDGAVTGFAGQTSREATHALQPVPDVGQEGSQRPLQVDPRAALHRPQADAAQRVAAHDEG